MLPNSENAIFEPSGDQVGSVAPQVTLSESEAFTPTRRTNRLAQATATIKTAIPECFTRDTFWRIWASLQLLRASGLEFCDAL